MPQFFSAVAATSIFRKSFFLYLILTFKVWFSCYAQDVEKTIKDTKNNIQQNPLTVTGSVGASSVFYQSHGIAARRDPFYWVINANLTFLLFNKISVPFSATLTQQDKNFGNGLEKFNQPFNQIGISPRYKWLTVHAGYRNVEFSEYSLSGAVFLGGGVEINPEKSIISGTAIIGRFIKAIPSGGIDGITVSLPAYERWGGGAKIKAGKNNNYGELIFFKAKDELGSIPFDTSLNVKPSENQVVGFTTKQQINKWLNAAASFTYSMFTDNLYDDVTKIERFTYLNRIYEPRSSSQFNKAITGGLDFTPQRIKLGLRYKRIDPDYKTLGAIFLTNDVEEYAVNASSGFYRNKINVAASTGFQRNNLDKIQATTAKRLIGSLNISYSANEHLNFSVSHSNFSSNTTAIRDVFTDSIKLIQVTQSETANMNYAFGKNKAKHNFTANVTYQESGGNKQALTAFTNGTMGYSILFTNINISCNTSLIYNRSYSAGNTNVSAGPSLGVQKMILNKKMRLSMNSSFQKAILNRNTVNKNLIINAGTNYTVNKHNSFRLEASYLKKIAAIEGASKFSEYRGAISYLYNFGIKKNKTA